MNTLNTTKNQQDRQQAACNYHRPTHPPLRMRMLWLCAKRRLHGCFSNCDFNLPPMRSRSIQSAAVCTIVPWSSANNSLVTGKSPFASTTAQIARPREASQRTGPQGPQIASYDHLKSIPLQVMRKLLNEVESDFALVAYATTRSSLGNKSESKAAPNPKSHKMSQ
eukprot:4079466-Amphidinium_carterae.1